MTPKEQLALVALVGLFAAGGFLRLAGCLAGPLAEKLNVPASGAGRLLSACGLAVIPATLAAGLLANRLGPLAVMTAGALIVALGFGALALSRTATGCVYGALVLGIGQACLSTAALALTPHGLFESSESASANLGFAVLGLGALVTPAFAEPLLGILGLRRVLWLAAAVAVVPSLAAIGTPAPSVPAGGAALPLGTLLTSAIFWVAVLLCLFYCPLEGCLGAWTPDYLRDLGSSAGRIRSLTWAFWLVFLGSRLGTAFLQQQEILPRGSEPWLVCVLGLLAVVALGNLAGTHRPPNATAGLLIAAAVLGPVLPTLVGLLFREFPGAQGTALGATLAAGAGGSLFLPALYGATARRGPLRHAMLAPTLTAILLVGSAVVLALQ